MSFPFANLISSSVTPYKVVTSSRKTLYCLISKLAVLLRPELYGCGCCSTFSCLISHKSVIRTRLHSYQADNPHEYYANSYYHFSKLPMDILYLLVSSLKFCLSYSMIISTATSLIPILSPFKAFA